MAGRFAGFVWAFDNNDRFANGLDLECRLSPLFMMECAMPVLVRLLALCLPLLVSLPGLCGPAAPFDDKFRQLEELLPFDVCVCVWE